MTQHVAHRHSDDVHVLEMRIERSEKDNECLRAELDQVREILGDREKEITGLRAEVERLTTQLKECIEECATVALEQRCERNTHWDLACVAIAREIRARAALKRR